MTLIKIFICILISSSISIKANSNEKFELLLKEGGKLIFIRHATAPGTGDPDNFDINDCSTQRNLNKEGILESKKIGFFFSNNDIKIDKVLTSEWCRCKKTAMHAFENYESVDFLNSFYDKKFKDNKIKQIKQLKKYIKKWNGKNNLILITHFVVISEILDINSFSSEIIITNKNFKILGQKKIKQL